MMYIHYCKYCRRIHILNGHKVYCPACSGKLTELGISYMKYVNLSKEEAMQAMILLRNNPTAQQLMKGSFWYDFKSLFYSKYSFEKTTFSITMSDKQYELDILPTESMTITDEQSIDERATQALMTLIMYETSVDKYLRMLGSTLGSCSA